MKRKVKTVFVGSFPFSLTLLPFDFLKKGRVEGRESIAEDSYRSITDYYRHGLGNPV